MNKQRVRLSFERHLAQYEREATVQRDIACELAAAPETHAPNLCVSKALEIGIGTGFLTRLLTQRYPQAEWWFNDLFSSALDWIPKGLRHTHNLIGDAETLPFPPTLNLLASASALQWFDAPENFIGKSYKALKEGGVLAVSVFGEKNFTELNKLIGTGLHYPTLQQWQTWIRQAGFRILTTSEWLCQQTFSNARDLLSHLRNTGVNGIAAARITTPRQLLEFEHRYRQAFAHSSENGKLPLTYHPLLLLAQKPASVLKQSDRR